MSTVTPNDSNTLVTVKIEGQEIKLAAAIANNDDLLRRVLAPVTRAQLTPPLRALQMAKPLT